MKKIFVSIASYRDPELLPTLKDLIEKADNPDSLTVCIAWQHSSEDEWDNLNQYKDDPRFKIIDIDYKDSKGACWARYSIQQEYANEEYYMQLDSHHRFIQGWDTECINMLENLKSPVCEKPLLTAYIPSYNPKNDPEGRVNEPWWMTFDRFIPEGAVFFLPATIPGWQGMTRPIPSRFLSAHFIFTIGKWCQEVPYDPEYYFHGEEISLAVRSFTWGYDLFHPHKVIAWHEYTREGRTKQWDDDQTWGERNTASHLRNRKLFSMDGECSCGMDFGPYGMGKIRTINDYSKFAGIRFFNRSIQQYTLDNNFAPNPIIENLEDYEKSFARIFKHCIDIHRGAFKEDDYDFWCVAFENADGVTINRQDANESEVQSIMNTKDQFYKIWRSFQHIDKPTRWVVWPHSKSKGWCDKIDSQLP